MFSAIVYKSTTGSCKRYAELLSARLHIPAFPLGKEYIPADTKIIFVGWLFAGKIMGYEKAEKKYDIGAVVQAVSYTHLDVYKRQGIPVRHSLTGRRSATWQDHK